LYSLDFDAKLRNVTQETNESDGEEPCGDETETEKPGGDVAETGFVDAVLTEENN